MSLFSVKRAVKIEIMKGKKRNTFQSQVIKAFLPATICIVLLSGIMMLLQGTRQVKKNARTLIAGTTRQTADIVDDKLGSILGKSSELKNSLAFWRIVNHSYNVNSSHSEYHDVVEVHKKMQDIYNDSDGAIDSIALQTIYQNRINVYYDMVYDYSELEYNNLNIEKHDRPHWINMHKDKVFSTKIPREVLSLVIPYQNSKNEQAALMVINFKADYFKNLMGKNKISDNGYILLLSSDGYLMPDSGKEYLLRKEQMEKILKRKGDGDLSFLAKDKAETLYVHYSSLKINEWSVVSVTPRSDLYSTLKNVRIFFIIIVFAAALLSFLVSVISSRYISQPVKKLSDQVLEFECDQNVVFDVKAGAELTTLAGGLNHLKETIDGLLCQVKEEQEQKSNLELMIMQSQIKPHFLYNTLGSIRALIDLNQTEEASAMCEALIQFYRYSLGNGNTIISLNEEIELVKNYLKILRFRYGDKFDYSFEVEDDIEQLRVPRMLLQPLVENAIYHGIKPKNGKGMILVSGVLKDQVVTLTVFDDGVGMDENTLSCLRKDIMKEEIAPGDQGSFALRNVYMRLKGFYGELSKMTVDSIRNVYTQIQIEVPVDSRRFYDVSDNDCR